MTSGLREERVQELCESAYPMLKQSHHRQPGHGWDAPAR